jgi:hypothetical protein
MLAEFPEMTPQGLGAMLSGIYQTHKGWELAEKQEPILKEAMIEEK